MMTCEQVRELIPWYVNGTLASNEAAEVATHIASCERCRAELASTLQLSMEVRTAVDEMPPLPERVWARVRTEKGGEVRLGGLDLGSLLLGLSLGLSITRRGRPHFTSNLRLLGRRVPIYSIREKEENNGKS